MSPRPRRSRAGASPPAAAPAVFRRPTRNDAVDLARATFLADERVDMRTLAGQLGVARATLYRWISSRETLLEALLEGFALEFLEISRSQAQGDGDDHMLDLVARLVGMTSRWPPVRGFIRREPELALRLLLGERGRVRRCLVHGLRDALTDAYSPAEAARLHGFVEVMVQVGAALEFSSLAAGDEPSAERVVQVGRALLAAARADALTDEAAA